MIEARGLSIALGRKPIVREVDLTARAGEVTIIVGPNGSGKSTLLKALSGETGYQGSVHLNGCEVSRMRASEQALVRAVLPQTASLSFPFTVREIVRLGASGQTDGERVVAQALGLVDLNGYGGRFYQELSGGDQQRVQLARVLCQVWAPVAHGAPRWLMLDEPVSSLDIRHQLTILDIASDYAARGGGVLAVLHDLNLAAMYGDAIIAMRDGQVRAIGTPSEVITNEIIESVFDCRLDVGVAPANGAPFVLPQSLNPSVRPI